MKTVFKITGLIWLGILLIFGSWYSTIELNTYLQQGNTLSAPQIFSGVLCAFFVFTIGITITIWIMRILDKGE